MSIRIAHVSDIHFGAEDVAAVAAAPTALAAFDPVLTVVTGDLTSGGRRREFAAARAWLDSLSGPLLVTPGNHDMPYWNLFSRLTAPFERYRRAIGPAMALSCDGPGLAARCINSARGAQLRPNWSKGALSIEALGALDWPAGPDVVRLFACHHPLVDLPDAPITGGVRNGLQAVSILARHGVDLVLSGHVHNPFAARLGGWSPPCYALGAGTLSTRTRGAPASFSTIVVDERTIEVVVQVWRDDRFEPGPARRLRRSAAGA